jgi:hypothetical protein
VTGQPDDGPLDGFATWQEQTAALEDMAKAAGLDGGDIPPGRCTEVLDGIVAGPIITCRHVHGHAGGHESAEGTVWWSRAAVPVGGGTPGDGLRELAEWLVSLDDDDSDSPGRCDRRTVTLTQIIDRARNALQGGAK